MTKKILIFILMFTMSTFLGMTAGAHEPHDDIYQVEVSPDYDMDSTVYVIVRKRLLRSRDGGDTWKRLYKGIDNKFPLFSMAISVRDSSKVFVSSLGDGVYASNDGGDTWSKLNSGLEDKDIRMIEVCSPGDRLYAAPFKGGLYLYNDKSSSWSGVLDKVKVTAITGSPEGSYSIAGAADGGIYVSRFDEKGWSRTGGKEYWGPINDIEISPLDPEVIYAATGKSGLLVSEDRGLSFRPCGEGMAVMEISDIELVPISSNRYIIVAVAANRGVFMSTDRGWSWRNISKGLTRNFQADRPDLLAGEGIPVEKRPHFNEIRIPGEKGLRGTMFLSGFDGLFRTLDGGLHWSEVETLGKAVNGVAVSPNYPRDGTLAVSLYSGGAYISTDAGNTWTSVAEDMRFLRHRKHYFRSGQDKDTVDLKYPRFFDIAIYPGTNGPVLCLTSLHIPVKLFRFVRGLVEETVLPYPEGGGAIVFSPDFDTNGRLYLISQKGSVYISDDKGESFERTGMPLGPPVHGSVSAAAAKGSKGRDILYYSIEGRGLIKTGDGGVTVTDISRGAPFEDAQEVLVDISPEGMLAIGTPDGLFTSTDGGSSWKNPGEGTPVRRGYIDAVAFAGVSDLFISVRGKGLFRMDIASGNVIRTGEGDIPLSSMLRPFSCMPLKSSPFYEEDGTLFGYGAAETAVFISRDRGVTWETISIADYNMSFTRRMGDKLRIMFYLVRERFEYITSVLRRPKAKKAVMVFGALMIIVIAVLFGRGRR